MEKRWVDVEEYNSLLYDNRLRVMISSQGEIIVWRFRDRFHFLKPEVINCDYTFIDGYKYVSFQARQNWKASHRIDKLMIESFFAEYSKKNNYQNHIIDYIDGDKDNIDLSNIQLLASKDYLEYHSQYAEFKKKIDEGLIYAKRVFFAPKPYLGNYQFY